MSPNNKLWMARPTLTDLNPFELNCYPFMISIDKWNGRRNAADDLPTKICVPSKAKNVNVKVFNMITKMTSCHCKCKFNSATNNSNQK